MKAKLVKKAIIIIGKGLILIILIFIALFLFAMITRFISPLAVQL
jgi:hypothetical protein